ncbi:MAG TPA: tripartite tricarboxylate transporter substrate binding protein, partial [Burkholderiales bacterium]|nr:tripartite tricarboxylate transporter substrate binding protein [Burkholderiales bacterium]
MKTGAVFHCARTIALACAIGAPLSTQAQNYPSRSISLYIGYAAGATTDLSARALAESLRKVLGVSVVAENKPGASAGVATTLVAKAKPDGYTLGVVSTGVITVRPHMFKTQYDPFRDIVPIAQYSRYVGALTVLASAPYKTVDDFIAYAKAHPGLSYSSAGLHTQQQLATELFRMCKGLEFTHVPAKGGSEANVMLMGKHVDFTAGSGGHLQYVKEGRMRMLLLFNTDKRDPSYPDVPTMREIGCQDAPALGYIVIAPSGMPEAVQKTLGDAVRRAVESSEFQAILSKLEIPYEYKDRAQLEKDTAE